jgi:D-alanine-D-alanine ligase
VKIAVLAGGRSAEREVSLWSGQEVQKALAARGHEAVMVDLEPETWVRLRDGGFDCAFIALHGRLGEDGSVQGMLEVLGLPYTGSGILASALCLDKTRCNQVLIHEGLPVPDFEEVEVIPGGDLEAAGLAERYGLPLVVKPVHEGSTIGLTIARNLDEVQTGLVEAGRLDRRVMVQRFVPGTEITAGLLATTPEPLVLPLLEITYQAPLYDYAAKYTQGQSQHIIPARIPARAAERATDYALRAFRRLGCLGMARVDMIVDGDEAWVLEVNTIPGLTALSLLPDAARAAGISFEDFCEAQVGQALALGGRRT